MFVGFSQVHSSLVPLVLNVSTGKISPQYHVVRIFKLDKEFYLDLKYDEGGNLITSDWPSLSTE